MGQVDSKSVEEQDTKCQYQELPQVSIINNTNTFKTLTVKKSNGRNTVDELKSITLESIREHDARLESYFSNQQPVYSLGNQKDIVDPAIEFLMIGPFKQAKRGMSSGKFYLDDTCPGYSEIVRVIKESPCVNRNNSVREAAVRKWVKLNMDYVVTEIGFKYGFPVFLDANEENGNNIHAKLHSHSGITYWFDYDNTRTVIEFWWMRYK